VRMAQLEKAKAEAIERAKENAATLSRTVLTIAQQAGDDGRLFGSVTNIDIVSALKLQGIEVEKAMVRMPEGPLKHTGDFALTVAPHTDVVANITVTVIGETAQG